MLKITIFFCILSHKHLEQCECLTSSLYPCGALNVDGLYLYTYTLASHFVESIHLSSFADWRRGGDKNRRHRIQWYRAGSNERIEVKGTNEELEEIQADALHHFHPFISPMRCFHFLILFILFCVSLPFISLSSSLYIFTIPIILPCIFAQPSVCVFVCEFALHSISLLVPFSC